jgi:hypothetical protein
MQHRAPMTPPPSNLYYGEQDENGIDISLIRENLRLSPLERIRRGNRAREQALRLLEYGRLNRQKSIRENP